jgi:hypothetical protein
MAKPVPRYNPPQIDDLKDKTGEIIAGFNQYVASLPEGSKARQTLERNGTFTRAQDGTVMHSSDFKNIVLARYFPAGMQLAGLRDFARFYNGNEEEAGGVYRDPGLIFKAKGSDSYMKAVIAEELKRHGFKQARLRYPQAIPLSALNVKVDENPNNPFGFRYVLMDNSQVVDAPMFSPNAPAKTFDKWNEETGLPELVEGERLRICTSNLGLTGLCVGGGWGAGSGGGDLVNSNENGRVLVVTGEACSQKSFAAAIENEKRNYARRLDALIRRLQEQRTILYITRR